MRTVMGLVAFVLLVGISQGIWVQGLPGHQGSGPIVSFGLDGPGQ